ncbi:MAG: hypothetical protein J6X66_09120 [Lachnospiraceae bacterium]|nr:hypothetical protein [Lachnospiraceae bacterium]
MIKKVVFIISIAVNIVLAIVLAITLIGAMDELKFEYVEQDTITPDTLRSNLERENYGVVASLSRPIRGGAEVAEGDEDYYRLGEYAELLFLKEVFDKAGNTDTVNGFEERISEIRKKMPEYGVVFDKIDYSLENAVRE